jgi:MoxR-like ATPase
VADVYVDGSVKEYILDICAATRASADVEYGASPRASLAFLNAGKARAAIHGRDYVIPDDVKALAHPILRHRLVLETDAELSNVSADDVVDDVLNTVVPPGGETSPTERASIADGGEHDASPSDAGDSAENSGESAEEFDWSDSPVDDPDDED